MSGQSPRGSPPHEGSGEDAQSRAVEDYLKAVYKLQQGNETVSTSALAVELDRSAASVTNMVQALSGRGLLSYVPYHGVRLTAGGELAALRIIRRHRVLELYLIEKLGFTWDNVHEEAERLEHAASDRLIDSMARALGEPEVDPHGSPIPTRDGRIEERELTRLTDLAPGTPAVVRQVSDESAEGLRALAAVGLFPGTRLTVRGPSRQGEELRLDVNGEEMRLDRDVAGSVFVDVL